MFSVFCFIYILPSVLISFLPFFLLSCCPSHLSFIIFYSTLFYSNQLSFRPAATLWKRRAAEGRRQSVAVVTVPTAAALRLVGQAVTCSLWPWPWLLKSCGWRSRARGAELRSWTASWRFTSTIRQRATSPPCWVWLPGKQQQPGQNNWNT